MTKAYLQKKRVIKRNVTTWQALTYRHVCQWHTLTLYEVDYSHSSLRVHGRSSSYAPTKNGLSHRWPAPFCWNCHGNAGSAFPVQQLEQDMLIRRRHSSSATASFASLLEHACLRRGEKQPEVGPRGRLYWNCRLPTVPRLLGSHNFANVGHSKPPSIVNNMLAGVRRKWRENRSQSQKDSPKWKPVHRGHWKTPCSESVAQKRDSVPGRKSKVWMEWRS